MVAQFANGTYGRLRITKDVIFDHTINFKSELKPDLPLLEKLVHDQNNANALRRQLIMPMPPAIHYDKHVTEMGCQNIP